MAPYVHEELKADRIVQAVAVSFLARILRGELIVEVVGDEIGEVTLDQATLEAACQRVEWNGPGSRMKRHEPPPAPFCPQVSGNRSHDGNRNLRDHEVTGA